MTTYSYEQAYRDTLAEFQAEMLEAQKMKDPQKLMEFMSSLDDKREARAKALVAERVEAEKKAQDAKDAAKQAIQTRIGKDFGEMWTDDVQGRVLEVAQAQDDITSLWISVQVNRKDTEVDGVKSVEVTLSEPSVSFNTKRVLASRGAPKSSGGVKDFNITKNGTSLEAVSWADAYRKAYDVTELPTQMSGQAIRDALTKVGYTVTAK